MIYDTLKLSKALRVSFTPEQSDTLAQAFSASTESTVATKLDIAELKAEIADVRTEIADVRTELKIEIAALRTEIANLRTEVKTDIAALRTEVKTDIATLKVDMVRWIVGAIAFNLLGAIGIMIAVAQPVLRAK